MERITSLQNPLVKMLKKLHTVSGRKETGLFLLEGNKLCEEGLRNHLDIRYCFCKEEAMELAERVKGAKCYVVSQEVLEKISSVKTPQSIVMAAALPQHDHKEIEDELVLALDGISDPANLGSMLRTAEAFGVRHILCSNQTVDVYSTKVLRGAMGSSFRVTMHRGDLLPKLTQLKNRGYKIYATALADNSMMLHKVSFEEKCVVVIGNEGNGVSSEVLELADQRILIPMKGENESLNAAAAAAVVLWQGYSKKEL